MIFPFKKQRAQREVRPKEVKQKRQLSNSDGNPSIYF